MKKTIIILLLLIIGQTIVFSQKYQPFDSTTIWTANQVYKIATNCYLNRDIKYFCKGYELNNSRLWNKVYYNDITTAAFCTSTIAPSSSYNNLLGFFWNDTLTKKVYFYQTSSGLPLNYTPNNCKIIYNFNKSIGDTMSILGTCLSIADFKITGIDSVLFSGKYHKRFLTTSLSYFLTIGTQPIAFMEGIGSSLGPFEPMLHIGGERYSYLKCFASPTQTLTVTNYTVFSAGICTNISLDINEIKETKSNIFPNPNNGSFKINIENKIDEIILYNSLGQKVYEQKLNRGENYINADKLSQGIYHYILFQNKQFRSSGKLTLE